MHRRSNSATFAALHDLSDLSDAEVLELDGLPPAPPLSRPTSTSTTTRATTSATTSATTASTTGGAGKVHLHEHAHNHIHGLDDDYAHAHDGDVHNVHNVHGVNDRGPSDTVEDTENLSEAASEDVEMPVRRVGLRSIQWRALTCVLLWYGFSISLSVYNKFMFSAGGMDFRFPILTTSIHQLTQLVLALLALSAMRVPATHVPFSERLRAIPAGLASASDIGMGNTSLLVVTLSFYTMIKSSALGFVLLFSVLFGIEFPSWRLAGIIGVMTIGVFMMVAGEVDFNWLGFFLVLGAACSSGLRWALTKIMLNGGTTETGEAHRSSDARRHHTKAVRTKKPHPVQTILALSPIMLVTLLVWGLVLEGPHAFVTAEMWSKTSTFMGICYIIFPGILAFGMTWAEFELLSVTGPLTLAIAGICKEVATILVSMFTFNDKLSLLNGAGLVVTVISIAMYHYYRIEV